MEYKVDGSVRNRKFVEALMPSIIQQLGLANSRKAVYIRIADECEGNLGLTVDLTAMTGGYVVIIKPQRNLKEIGLTLAHEMVHVKQMAKGTLKPAKNGVNFWVGKKYGKKTPYLSRPWEVEAFMKQELILRRAFE